MLADLLHRSDRQDKKAIQIGLHLARGLEPGKSTITASKDDPKMKQAVVTALRKISKEERRKMASENLSYSSSFDFEGGGSGGGGGGGGGYHQTPRVFGKGYSKASFFEKNRIQREGEISPRSGGGGGEFGGVGGGIEQQRWRGSDGGGSGGAEQQQQPQQQSRRHFLTSQGQGEAVGALLRDTFLSNRRRRGLRRNMGRTPSLSTESPRAAAAAAEAETTLSAVTTEAVLEATARPPNNPKPSGEGGGHLSARNDREKRPFVAALTLQSTTSVDEEARL